MSKPNLESLLSTIPVELRQGLELPPKIYVEMEGELLGYKEGKLLTIRYPFKEYYQNPFGYMQGGIISAAIDNTVAPLSYLACATNITKSITTKFIRPVLNTYSHIIVEARLNKSDGNNITLNAVVRSPEQDLLATGVVECIEV